MQDTLPLYAAAAGAFVTYLVVTNLILPLFSTQAKFVNSTPWVGVKKQWFGKYRAGITAIMDTPGLMREGYQKFSKNNKLFVLPQFSRDPFVVIPGDKVMEFLSIPDDRVDHETIGRESIAFDYIMDRKKFPDSSHFDVVRRQLTRKLPLLTNDVYHELVLSMKRNWPAKTEEWTTVNIYPTCMKIVSQAANRVFSGKVLCRNPVFLDSSRLYAQNVFKAGALLKLIPDFLHPIAAPIIMRPVRKHFNICKNLARPVIADRIHRMKTQGKSYEPEVDVLQWVLDDSFAVADTQPWRLELDWLCQCLLLLNMVAIHTTSMVTANTMMDIYSSPHREEYVAGLRQEAEATLQRYNGEWSKDAVNDMLRVDSVIRETMRVSGLGDLGMPRLIKDPNGVTLSGGLHIPYGVRVVMPTYSVMVDEKNFDNPLSWDGFRFSRPREAFNATQEVKVAGDKARLEKVLELKNQSLVTTNESFYTFGAVRHACPGRFFASQEMKLMIAYVATTYDIKIDGGRPKNLAINGANVPTDTAEMQIRLRAQ